MNGPQTTWTGHASVVWRDELLGDVQSVEVDGQTRRRVAAVTLAADRHRTTLGQAERHDRRAARDVVVVVGGVHWARRRLQRLGQTAVCDDVDPLHRRWSNFQYQINECCQWMSGYV